MSSKKKLEDIKKKTINGTLQLIIREFGLKAVTILGQIILIKILAPSAFGVFAVLSFILSTAEIFTDIGFNLSVIQEKGKPNKNQLSTIFNIKLLLTFFFVLLLLISSNFLPHFYKDFGKQEQLMLQLLSLTLFLKPFQSITTSMIERDLKYKAIALIDISGISTYYFFAITFAFFGFEVWSFIWATFAKSIAEFVCAFFSKPWIPFLRLKISEVKNYINLGKYFQLGIILVVIKNSIIPIIAGTNLPISSVGLLDWSANIASFPRVFIDNVGRVIFSSFSRMQNDKKNIAKGIELTFEVLSIPAIFIIPLTLFLGYDAILYFLNDKWLKAIPSLSWYVASIFFLNGNGLLGHALLAIGKIKKMLISGFILMSFELISAYVLLKTFGFQGVAMSFFISNLLLFVVLIYLCKKADINIRFTKTIIRNLTILIILSIFVYSINIFIGKNMFLFIIKVFLSTIVYIFILFIFSKKLVFQSTKLFFNNLKENP